MKSKKGKTKKNSYRFGFGSKRKSLGLIKEIVMTPKIWQKKSLSDVINKQLNKFFNEKDALNGK